VDVECGFGLGDWAGEVGGDGSILWVVGFDSVGISRMGYSGIGSSHIRHLDGLSLVP